MDPEEVQEQFLSAYDQYADDIYRFCVLKVSNREIAEDLTQEVFMRYWQQLRSGTAVEYERALLYTMARNLVIDWYRKRKEQSLDVLTESGFEFSNEDDKKIQESAQMREVLDVVAKLDESSREAVLLRFVDGFSPQDIAAITGETANTISVRINRSIKKIQGLMQISE